MCSDNPDISVSYSIESYTQHKEPKGLKLLQKQPTDYPIFENLPQSLHNETKFSFAINAQIHMEDNQDVV